MATRSRADIARSAAEALARTDLAGIQALVGFDGFIDSIIRLVGTRRSMRHDDFEPIATITAFAQRCASCAGKSANIETVVLDDRFGGNGPLLAGALGQMGASVTFIGAVGEPRTGVHPIFEPFAKRCKRVVPVCPPSSTACFEFEDGKLMFNNTANVQAVTWDRLVAVLGESELAKIIGEAKLLGLVNWSLSGGVPGIWKGLAKLMRERQASWTRRIFVDLSDPAKRTDADIRTGMAQLRELAETPGVALTLGVNLSESERISRVMNVPAFVPGQAVTDATMIRAAQALRAALGIDTLVLHRRQGAAGADARGATASFEGPFTRKPVISTGAGDHFNSGCSLAQTLGLPLEECLAVGCAVSGAYVRDAVSPTKERLVSFLRDLPDPEPQPQS